MSGLLGFFLATQLWSASPAATLHIFGASRPHEIVGVATPVLLTTPGPVPRRTLSPALRIKPSTPFHLLRVDADSVAIVPTTAWQADTQYGVQLKGFGSPAVHFTTDGDHRLVINLTQQTLSAYAGNTLVRQMSVNTGAPPQWSTPTGRFWIYRRVPDEHMQGGTPGTPESWDVAHVPDAQYFNDAIALHGAWWTQRFGHAVSHGCVQLSTQLFNPDPDAAPDAEWLWGFSHLGTPVTVLGKAPEPMPH